MSEMWITVCPILVDQMLDVFVWWVHLTASVSLVVLEMVELDANALLLKLTDANLKSVVPMLNVDLIKKESDNASALQTFLTEIPIKVVHHHLEVRLSIFLLISILKSKKCFDIILGKLLFKISVNENISNKDLSNI